MTIITVNSKKYTLADDIIIQCPIWCKGVRNGRELIKKKEIPTTSYIYARKINDEWSTSDGKSVKFDKVFVRLVYLKKIDNYVKEVNKEDDIVDDNNIEKAPPIINLKDSEKFHDDNGNVLEIETRGVREHDKIYFKVKDVSEAFGSKNICKNIVNSSTLYIENNDYKYFICEKEYNLYQNTSKNRVSKEIFFTYEGIIRFLFVSRCGNANNFIKWATETLFTAQMGTLKQKKKLASNLLGVPVDDFNNIMLKPNTKTDIASIYFIVFGTGKDLRGSMYLDDSIGDDDIIGIYGYTDNLRRRLVEHKNKYKNIKNANLTIKYYSFIDKSLLSKAEKDVKDYFIATCSHLEYDNETEMVCIDDNILKYMESQYQTIGKKYEGDNKTIITKMKEMEVEHKYEIALKDKEIEMKDNEIKLNNEKHAKELAVKDKELAIKDKDLALKDVEILQWKVKYLESKNE